MSEYDLIIVGGGPGGYNAAERAAAGGLKTLVIEKEHLGGVCLNRGCIPTKTLLAAAKHYHIAADSADFGVNASEVVMDWPVAMKRKTKTVRALRSGVGAKLKKHKVDVIEGEARFTGPKAVEVNGEIHTGGKILIATGSRPFVPPIPGAESCLTSREILDIDHVPESLVVIGGGVIGLEFASLFSTLGSKVTVVEMLPEIVPSLDGDVAALLRKRLEGQVTFKLGAKVEKIDGGMVSFSQADGSGADGAGSVSGEAVLMSVGRRPVTDGMGLEEIGLDIQRGAIVVDERMRTNLPGVWAAGDCTGKSLLAHSAYRMGEVAVNDMLGRQDRMRYNAVPSVVYSLPEAAGVGLTEADAAKAGRKVVAKQLPMQYSGRYLAEYGQQPGFGKVVVDAETRALLGVHLVGGQCSEIIWGAAALIEAEFRVDEAKELIFPHPTVSEIIRETIWEF